VVARYRELEDTVEGRRGHPIAAFGPDLDCRPARPRLRRRSRKNDRSHAAPLGRPKIRTLPWRKAPVSSAVDSFDDTSALQLAKDLGGARGVRPSCELLGGEWF